MAITPKKTSKTKKSPLTTKVRKLIKGKSEGKTTREACKKAGLNEQYACDLLKKPEIKASLQELMDKAGLSDDVLLAKHVELLDAKRSDKPDYQTQKGALEMAYKLKSAFVEKKEITGADGGPVKVEAEVIIRPSITREEWLKIHGLDA